jgi:hypothetical protein
MVMLFRAIDGFSFFISGFNGLDASYTVAIDEHDVMV